MMYNPFAKFQYRSKDDEIMDDLNTKGEALERTLLELDIINTYLGGNTIVLRAIAKLFKEYKDETISIADLGCGSGTLLMLIAEAAKEHGKKVKLTGIDANDYIVQYAKDNAFAYPEIEFVHLDVLDEQFSRQSFDVVICSLFCHHLSEVQLTGLLNRLYAQTSRAIIISDLHRHWFAYYSISTLTSLFSSSVMVKNDAKLSVLKAFKRIELQELLMNMGISRFSLKWKWAFRFELIIDCRKKNETVRSKINLTKVESEG